MVTLPPFIPGPGFYSCPAGHSTAQRPSSWHLYLCLSATTPAQPTLQDWSLFMHLGHPSCASTHSLSARSRAYGCHIYIDISLSTALWPTSYWATQVQSPVMLHPFALHSGTLCPTHTPVYEPSLQRAHFALHFGFWCPIIPLDQGPRPQRGSDRSSRTSVWDPVPHTHPWTMSLGSMGSSRTSTTRILCRPNIMMHCHRSKPSPPLAEDQLLG